MHSFGRTIKLVLLAAVAMVLLSSSASAAEIIGSRVQAESVTTAITTNQYFSSAEPKDGNTPNTSRINSNGTVNYPVTIPSGASASAVVVRSRSASTSTGSVNLTVVVDGVDQPAKTITKTERTFATRTWNLSTALGAGSHTIGLKATNTTTANRAISDYFYLDGTSGPPPDTTPPDATPPDTSITSGPAEGSTDIDGDVSFAFSGSDDVGVASFECEMDGAAFAACTSPQAYSALSDGAHTFSVMAKDAAGNVDASPAVRNFSVARPAPISHQARSASDFVDSIGVVVHIPSRSTPYGDYAGRVKPALDELDVRHVRDAAVALSNSTVWGRYSDLCQILGIHLTLNINKALWPTAPTAAQLNTMLSQANCGAGQTAIEAWEGSNEYNNGRTDSAWVDELEAYQQDSFNSVNGSNRPDLPLLAAPLGKETGMYPPEYVNLDLSGTSDANNMHSYPGGNAPTYGNPSDPPGYSLLFNRDIPVAEQIGAPGRDLYSTETGYTTADGITVEVNDTAKGRYTPRLSFEYFNAGIERHFHYQLLDHLNSGLSHPQSHYGLIDYSGVPKESFRSLENLIDVVDEPDVENPGTLSYAIRDALPTTHSTLLAAPNGVFYLALWQEVVSYDKAADVTVEPPDDEVTIDFGQSRTIEVYPVNDIVSSGPSDDADTHPSRTVTATSITEPIEDEVKVFRIG
jgi:hypothetical protein